MMALDSLQWWCSWVKYALLQSILNRAVLCLMIWGGEKIAYKCHSTPSASKVFTLAPYLGILPCFPQHTFIMCYIITYSTQPYHTCADPNITWKLENYSSLALTMIDQNAWHYITDKILQLQGRRKVWKSGCASNNWVGMICPPLVEIGLTDLPPRDDRPELGMWVLCCSIAYREMAWDTRYIV